jgi:hypothetical protein
MSSAVAVLNAHDVWATQDSIEPFIASPTETQAHAPLLPLGDVLHKLQAGLLAPTDLPAIRVVYHEGRWFSLDNRRLWLFHHLPKPCPIPVQVTPTTKEFFQKLTRNGSSSDPTPRLKHTAQALTYSAAASTKGPVPEASNPSGRYMYQGQLDSLVLKWSEVNITNMNYFNTEQVRPHKLSFCCHRMCVCHIGCKVVLKLTERTSWGLMAGVAGMQKIELCRNCPAQYYCSTMIM